MSPIQQTQGWVERLIQNPYDHKVLRELSAATAGEPQSYAALLEHAADVSKDDAAASYFLTEAALVQLSLLRNSSQGLVLLRRALDRDPLNARAAETLTSAYRGRNDNVALGSMLKARAEALERLSARDPELVSHAADVYETLGVHYAEVLGQLDASVSAFRHAIALLRGREPHTFASPPLPPAEEATPAESAMRSRHRNKVESAVVPPPVRAEAPPDEELATSPNASSMPIGPPTDPDFFRPTDRTVDPDKVRQRRVSLEAPPSPAPPEAASEDRLMGLFEALHAVRFCRSVQEASALIVQIVRDALGAESALLHLYDPITREYVVTAALGSHHRTAVGVRSPETDPLLERAFLAATAVVASPVVEHEHFTTERWNLIEPRRSVVCAPILDDGSPLGALEIVDPKDRPEFDEHDRDAMTYVGGRVAEFIAERGGFVG